MLPRAAELAEIESFINTYGVTRCPPRYVGGVFAAIPRETEIALMAKIVVVERGLSFKEERDRHFARLALSATPSK
jgi:hypothetical protein